MEYNFIIGNHLFVVHADYDIPWNDWHYNFIYESIHDNHMSRTDYYLLCFVNQPDVSQYKQLYHGETQYVYDGPEGEIRVHYLVNNVISIMCEEKKDAYYIHINYAFMHQAYMYLVAMMLEKVLLEESALILHSSFIEYKGKAILFTGPSGIGKSTQAELWVQHKNATLINGDRTLLKSYQNSWNACGFPICGTSGTALDERYPIAAIVYLKQSKENSIVQLNGFKAFKNLLSEVSVNYWNRERSEKAMEILQDICCNIPVFCLSCTPTQAAVECVLKEIM